MKTALPVALLFACSIPLPAQISTSLSPVGDGSTMIKIKNDGTSSLTAFVVSAKMVNNSSDPSSKLPRVLYSDPLVDAAATPLLPDQERLVDPGRIRFHGGKTYFAVFEEPIAFAGVFDDGKTAGDPVLLERLLRRRSSLLQAVDTALEMLSDAGKRNVPRAQLVAQFKRMADSVNRWYVPAEQRVGKDVYQSIVSKLIHLPENQIGAAFPPTAFVEEEVSRLNRQRVELRDSQPNLSEAAFLQR